MIFIILALISMLFMIFIILWCISGILHFHDSQNKFKSSNDFHNSTFDFHEFQDFCDSHMEFSDFHDFQNSRMDFYYLFIDFCYSLMDF